MPSPTPIAVLGATGTVGQKLIRMLMTHPRFRVGELIASERNLGKPYGQAVLWKEETPLPESLAARSLCSHEDIRSPFALSALPEEVAGEVEPALMERGIHVVSNASAHRMDPQVPLVIPEINKGHLELLESQSTPGKIVTNPNCAAIFAALGVAPLLELGKLEHLSLTTLQAVSGAGYPGVPSLDILGNIIPLPKEEEKIEREMKRILGKVREKASFSVTAHAHRVPVLHGHTVALHLFFDRPVTAPEAIERYEAWNTQYPKTFCVHGAQDRPQPTRDIHSLDQRVHIGRLKQGDGPHILGLISQGHNLVRGAAGAALLNLEALEDYLG
ncbi:MAG: aspartate-semialdehyde dehydrogenase [Bacteriovoracales bacterium]|nr:aspartate-semialdehyde dehydrogenase [Bacteriovoracales bacterium]